LRAFEEVYLRRFTRPIGEVYQFIRPIEELYHRKEELYQRKSVTHIEEVSQRKFVTHIEKVAKGFQGNLKKDG
jgi:hypothetical protein